MSTGVPGPAELREAEPSAADDLTGHALALAAALLGERRAVEATGEPLPVEAEAVTLLSGWDDRDLLRLRLRRVREAAEAGVPAVAYVANPVMEPSGSGVTPDELRRAFEGVSGIEFLAQRGVECSVADLEQGSPGGPSGAGAGVGPPRRMLVVANLPDAARAEAHLAADAAERRRRSELERRLAELRSQNVELARARTGRPLDESARTRARLAERRLLFARVRETLSALLARRRLRG